MSQRVKFIKDYDKYHAGQVVVVDNNLAHAAIEGGYAVLSKDMVQSDYKTKKGVRIPIDKRGRASTWRL